MTGLVDELVSRAILDGEIPDTTPGLILTLRSADLEFQIGSAQYIATPHEAKTLYRWLGEADTNRNRRLGDFYRSLELRRAGTALVLEIKRAGKTLARLTMTGGIPTDVRRQIATAYRDDKWHRQSFED